MRVCTRFFRSPCLGANWLRGASGLQRLVPHLLDGVDLPGRLGGGGGRAAQHRPGEGARSPFLGCKTRIWMHS